MGHNPLTLFESFNRSKYPNSYRFENLVAVISTDDPALVESKLTQVEDFVKSKGYYAAGYISYEASSGFSSYLVTHRADFPLLWFGIYRDRVAVEPELDKDDLSYLASDWSVSQDKAGYTKNIGKIREYIARGDLYQLNYTIKQRFRFFGDTYAYYKDLCAMQPASFCAYISTERYDILSASPELFFEIKNGVLTTSPMKGTIKRGKNIVEDNVNIERLKNSEKERAENLMIVDLLRNDMAKVSVTGSVVVKSLFDIESLDTVHQMSSLITSDLDPNVSLVDVMRALFPCGSVTGAPKKRVMEIIKELEEEPRGIYTGCIGYISPDKTSSHGIEAVFSVAIRTAVIDKQTNRGEIGIGSGVTYDSSPEAEYNECLLKSQCARETRPDFELIETMLLDKGVYFLLERHLNRLKASAKYFNFNFDQITLFKDLSVLSRKYPDGTHKVRLLLDRNGKYMIESEPVDIMANKTGKIIISDERISPDNIFLYHKTTNRPLYNEAVKSLGSGILDIIFANQSGEVTEGANNNIVAAIDGVLCTPPVSCGLLPGTFRQELIDTHIIEERVITLEDLKESPKIFLINSVRKWREVKLA